MTTLKFGIMIANTIMKLKQKPSTATKNLQHHPFTVQQMSTEMQLSKLSQGNATLTSSHLPNTLSWKDHPFTKAITKAREAQHQRHLQQPTKPKIIAKHARGTMMRAPALKFHIIDLQRQKRNHANLMHIIRKGVGFHRTSPQTFSLDTLLREARDTDITNNFLNSIQKYARTNLVHLKTVRLEDSGIPLSELTDLCKGKVSFDVLTDFLHHLKYDLNDNTIPIIKRPIISPTSGFAKNTIPYTCTTADRRSKRQIFIPVFIRGTWILININKNFNDVTVLTNQQDTTAITEAVFTWRNKNRIHYTYGSHTQIDVQQRQSHIITWILDRLFASKLYPKDLDIAILVAQTIVRGSMAWKDPTPPPSEPDSEHNSEPPEDIPPPFLDPLPDTPHSKEDLKFAEAMGAAMNELNERGWSWEKIVKEVQHFDNLHEIRQWQANLDKDDFACTDDNTDWSLIPDAVVHSSDLENFSLVNQNMGGRGMRRGWDQVLHVMRNEPAVATFQEIKVPRHKILSLEKLVTQHFPNYLLFTNIAEGKGATGGVPHGVATLVRHDFMNNAKVLQLSEQREKQIEGRVLAIQIRGSGAKAPITIINVYQAVSKVPNKHTINNVLQSVLEFRNLSTEKNIPTVAVGDWNAVTSSYQRFNYKGDSWKKGDEVFQRFIRKCEWGVQLYNGGVEPTWVSQSGAQSACLDHVLYHPPFLRITPVEGNALPDSRFDHISLSFEIDGRDAGYKTELDKGDIHYPRLITKKWDQMSLIVHDLFTQNHKNSTEPNQTVWDNAKAILKEYWEAAKEVLGTTQKPTGRKPFKLKGHKQLHREINQLRTVKKKVHALPTKLTAINREILIGLRDETVDILRGTAMTPTQFLRHSN